MSPERSWRSASHDAGWHGWLPPKNWRPGPPERQDKVDTICTVPLDCGTPTTRRLYPFGALLFLHVVHKCVTNLLLLSKSVASIHFCSLHTCSLIPLIDRICSLFYILVIYLLEPTRTFSMKPLISLGWVLRLQ